MANEPIIGAFLALMAACCWGSAGVLYKSAIKPGHSLFLSIVYRGIIAVPFIGLIAFLVNGFETMSILFQPEIFVIVLLSSLFVSLGDLGFFASLQLIDVSKSQPVASVYPLFTIFFLILLGFETVSLIVIAATGILILGIGLVSQKDESSSNPSYSEKADLRKGLILAIAAAFFWSFAILTLDYLLDLPGVDVFSLATIRFGILTLMIGILWILFDKYQILSKEEIRIFDPISKHNIIIFGLSGILSWGLGALAFFTSIQLIGSARATPISSINPLVAVILGVVFLREKFSPLQAVGILLVCCGSIVISIF
jgi:DME family drug/metabolite transporter